MAKTILNSNIFKYSDYKALLQDLLGQMGEVQKGLKSKFADSCGMNRTYLPQILNFKAHLSEEQAFRAGMFFGFNALELRYFQLLVRLQKAATPDLTAYYISEQQDLIQQSKELDAHLNEVKKQNEGIASTYYSQWFYSAVHIALYNPRFQQIPILSEYLGLQPTVIIKIINFLVSAGLAEAQKDGAFAPVESNFHLPKGSPHVFKHHSNWRLKALESLDKDSNLNFHYTSVFGLSRSDLQEMKDLFLRFTTQTRDLIGKSNPEEVLGAYCLDFFVM